MSILLYILLSAAGLYALIFLFMNISLLILKNDYWYPLFVYFNDTLRDVFDEWVTKKRIYINPIEVYKIGYFVFMKKYIRDMYPFKETLAGIKTVGYTDKSYDHILQGLIERRKYGEAIVLSAFICNRTKSVPVTALFACDAFVDNNWEINAEKYPKQIASDIHAVFVTIYNLYYSQDDSPYQKRYKNYISDPNYLHVDEEVEKENNSEDIDFDIYKNYSDKIDVEFIKNNDEILYNAIFRLHISSIERVYAHELDKSNLDSLQVISKLLEMGMVSAATLAACEIADRDYVIRKKCDGVWDDYCVKDDESFARLLNIIIREQFENFSYLDEFTQIVVDCKKNHKNFLSDIELQELFMYRDILKGTLKVNYDEVTKDKTKKTKTKK